MSTEHTDDAVTEQPDDVVTEASDDTVTPPAPLPPGYVVVGPQSTIGRLIAPVASLAAGWGVRRAMDAGYRRRTGSAPPSVADPRVSMTKVILWAAATAAALAIVNVVIDRVTMRAIEGEPVVLPTAEPTG